MRFRSCVAFTFLCGCCFAQSNPQRDIQAIDVLQRSSTSMSEGAGFTTPVLQLPRCKVEGTGTYLGRNGTFQWVNDQKEFRYENTVNGHLDVYVSGHGDPAGGIDGHVHRIQPHVGAADLPTHLAPLLIALYANDATFQLKRDAPEIVGSLTVDVVEVADASSALSKTFMQKWRFDHQTGFPLDVEYKLPSHFNAANLMTFRDQFSNFRPVEGYLWPTHIDRFLQNRLMFSFDLSRIHCGGTSSPAEFEIGGGR